MHIVIIKFETKIRRREESIVKAQSYESAYLENEIKMVFPLISIKVNISYWIERKDIISDYNILKIIYHAYCIIFVFVLGSFINQYVHINTKL